MQHDKPIIVIDANESTAARIEADESMRGSSVFWASSGRYGIRLAEKFPEATVVIGPNVEDVCPEEIARAIRASRPSHTICRYAGSASDGDLTGSLFDVQISPDTPIIQLTQLIDLLDVKRETSQLRAKLSRGLLEGKVAA